MSKGMEDHRNFRKKAKLTLKEKRLRKKEKKQQRHAHEIRDIPVEE